MRQTAAMFPLAQRYRNFLDVVFGGLCESSPARWDVPPCELDLQSLWFAGEFGTEFVTTDGRQVTIRDFGTWNHASGPDFTGCAISCGGGILQGDIELDPDVRDWERHGHGANDAFENVVLHLFVTAPENDECFTRTAAHRKVLQVQLRAEMLCDGVKPRHMPEARLGRCAVPLADMPEANVLSLLEAAAQYRLQRKSEKLAALIRIHGRAQAVYQSLANALGYRHNQRPLTVLTQRFPVRALLQKSAGEREALIFGCSGFLDAVKFEDTEPDTRVYLRTLWSEWWKVRAGYVHWLEEPQRLRWQTAGARPGNHPQRRLGALSAMLRAWRRVIAPLQSAAAWNRETFSDTLLALEHDYWSRHYTLLAAPSVKPMALIGATRVQEILANVCYPLLVPESEVLWVEYKLLPAVLDNQKVRRAALRLFGGTPRAAQMQKRVFHQQGLLQIYEDYCLADDSACADCPFPEKLREWKS